MATTFLSQPSSSVSVEQIRAFEARNAFCLPDSYKSFLLRDNGGRPTPSGLIIPGWHGISTGITAFLGLGEGGYYDLESSFQNSEDYIPKGYVPIAVDTGGNMLCLGLSGSVTGIIYFWDHEDPMGEDPRKLKKIADSVDDLLDMFMTDEVLDTMTSSDM